MKDGRTEMFSIQRGFLFRKNRPYGINGFWTAYQSIINFTFLSYHTLSIIPSIPRTVCDVMMSCAQLLAAALGQMRCPSDATTASLFRQWHYANQFASQNWWGLSNITLQKGNTWTANHCSDNSAFDSRWSVRCYTISRIRGKTQTKIGKN